MNRSPSPPNEPGGISPRELALESKGGIPQGAAQGRVTRNVVAELRVSTEEETTAQVYDCWNEIGVAGNGSCQELLRYVHCRNCGIYMAAARQLLDRPVTADYRHEWSEYYAGERKLTTPAKTSVVIFRIGSEWLALPTQEFQEVAELRALHTLPHRRRDIVLGLVNVRGELLICVSLERLLGLGLGEKPSAENLQAGKPKMVSAFKNFNASAFSQRLLVANWEGNRIAFPVEEVPGIHRIHRENLQEPPATIAKSMHTCSRGVFAWRDHTVGFLDAGTLFAMVNRNLT